MVAKSLPEMIEELPPDAQNVVRDLVELLLSRPKKAEGTDPHILRQDWAGALRDYRDLYSAVELQHKVADWRSSP